MVKVLLLALIVVSGGCQRRIEYVNVPTPVPCPAATLPARPDLPPDVASDAPAGDVVNAALATVELLGGYCLALETLLQSYGGPPLAPDSLFHQPGNP